jgi:AAA family ATP:ADP antiporter
MANKIIRALWGDLHGEELKKYALLAMGFFFLIGSFWPLKTLKLSIFLNTVGPLQLPYVKLASVMIFFPLVLLYSKLVDIFKKENLIYLFISVYTMLGLVFVYFLAHPSIGVANTVVSPNRIIGWAFYLFCESYIDLGMALYWSFVNDLATPESAKKGYGLLMFGSQLGGLLFTIIGSALAYDTTLYAQRVPLIALISVLMFIMIAVAVALLTRLVGTTSLKGYTTQQTLTVDEKKKEASEAVSFIGGLTFLLKHPYVMSIFGLVFFQEVALTVMDYQLSLLVATTYTDPGHINKFSFEFSLAVQAVSCFFALVGTSFFHRKFGIRSALICYPIGIGLFVGWYLLNPTLWTAFYVMLVARALGYALNQPTRETLYIPTSRAIKYKSKAWIDMFGKRFAKGSGSVVNGIIGSALTLAGGFTLGVIALWIGLASVVGSTFNKTIAQDKLIE